MAEKKNQVKAAKAAAPAAEHTASKKKPATAPAAKAPLAEVENALLKEEDKVAKAAASKKKPAAKPAPAVEIPVEQPVQEAVPVAKTKKKPAAKSAAPAAAPVQETAVLAQVPAKPAAPKKAAKVPLVQIDHACELALEKLRQQNAQGQYSVLVAELEWVLGSYRFDGNPIGVYQKVNAALEELLALKAQSSSKVSQKLIEQLERALKN